eukprot:NODE_18212_length_904_cov_12.338481.p4 GENE.NODE_18212_length_904_cov_12.338481~~NODE_18212_length_904_cov_12.338481.p4  ORF type:complete len:88 (+),score=15.74 NODE_18212_length_904_cov_12.338481:519-782(+)
MAHQIRAVATPGIDVVVVCSALHCEALSETLRRGGALEVDLAELAERSLPVWPFYVLGYAIIPGAVLCYALASAWESFVVPTLNEMA